ncbi:MAG: hypothetical protein FWC03_12225 [Treponema sp.]|nr:hypothetical protein [Treponema sp.]
MKKFLALMILFACFVLVSVSAWEPNDLTKYPPSMNENNWLINFGAGFYLPFATEHGITNNRYIPTIRVSVDKNTPLGDRNLPFFFGGILGYSMHGHTDYFYLHSIKVGARFGYHFNWGIENLDTYAVVVAGWNFNIYDNKLNNTVEFNDLNLLNDLLAGLNFGARWYVNDWFGFWVEAGYTTSSLFDIGLSFKF